MEMYLVNKKMKDYKQVVPFNDISEIQKWEYLIQ